MARYIDADKVLLELQKFSLDTSNSYGVGYSDCLTAVEDVLNETPTADVVEVKHAKWINIASIGNKRCFGQCSFCGTRHEAQNASELKLFHRRCHWCGAKMDGGKAE